MNNLNLRWELGKVSTDAFHRAVLKNEFEKLKEATPNVYSHRRSQLSFAISSLALDPTGQFLLSTSEDGSVALWALDEQYVDDKICNKRVRLAKGESREQGPSRPSKTHIVARPGMQGKRPRFRTYIGAPPPPLPVEHHAFAVTSVKWYTQDNGLFFTGSNDEKVKLWDTNSFQVVHSLDIAHRVSQLDTRDDLIAIASEDSHPRLVDLKSMSAAITLGVRHSGMKFGINTAKFSTGSHPMLATGDEDGNARVWDLRMGNKALCDLTEPDTLAKAHAKSCNDLCWNPTGGSEIVTTGNDGKCKVWSLEQGKSKLLLQLGSTDLMRNRFKRRTSHYLMWHGPYVFWNSDYGEVLAFQAHDGKLWNTFEYPLVNTKTTKTPRFQSMALQTSLSNTIGMRMFLGTDHIHGQVLEYRT
ncbi:LAFE_0E04170g1_1 [Lachancea fermentati]|uniref:LAFE_0E04170g1_1 n=1 Tax=Lachancea fermentati TaxID=4955 RepID=A0A1G4MCQ1_LACFM|nr:LAFE_0E04170g1_1 [Lachancea fermentati]